MIQSTSVLNAGRGFIYQWSGDLRHRKTKLVILSIGVNLSRKSRHPEHKRQLKDGAVILREGEARPSGSTT